MSCPVRRVLDQGLEVLDRLFVVAGDVQVVGAKRPVLLALRHAVHQRERLLVELIASSFLPSLIALAAQPE